VRAAWYQTYGPPSSVRVREIPDPVPKADQVVVRVKAAAVNPLDLYYLAGTPLIARPAFGLFGPKRHTPGVDVSGVVEAVGADVTRFAAGDEVWGNCSGAFAERVATKEKQLVHKPVRVTFEQAAAVSIAGLTALQAVRDHAAVQPGQHVVINGASGGVGTFAVQIAKHMGARVTGVCSTKNVEMVRSLGADLVVDYTVEDFTRLDLAADVMIDNIGNRTVAENCNALAANGVYVGVGAPKGGRVLGPIRYLLGCTLRSPFVSQRLASFTASVTLADHDALNDLLDAGAVVPVIDRTFRLDDVVELLELQASGRIAGKALLTF